MRFSCCWTRPLSWSSVLLYEVHHRVWHSRWSRREKFMNIPKMILTIEREKSGVAGCYWYFPSLAPNEECCSSLGRKWNSKYNSSRGWISPGSALHWLTRWIIPATSPLVIMAAPGGKMPVIWLIRKYKQLVILSVLFPWDNWCLENIVNVELCRWVPEGRYHQVWRI